MSKLSVASLVASMTLLAAAQVRGAEASDVPTAVLGLEALEGVPESIATEITDALRQRIAATKGYQLVQGKDLVEVKLVFSCSDEAPACMSQASKSMGASKLVFGSVKKTGGDYVVTLKLLDANRGTVENWETETVPKKRADQAAFRSLAPAWLAGLTNKGAGGNLQVRANVSGGAVSLDGNRVGVTGSEPVVIPDVAPGRHEVSVEKSGYTTTKQEFTLAAGQSLPLSLALSPLSGEAAMPATSEPVTVTKASDEEAQLPPDGSSRTLSRVGFWVAVVGAVAAAGFALKFGNDVRQINSELDPYRRFPCSGSSTGLCGAHGETDKQPLTLAERSIVDGKTNDGNRAQTWQWVCVGLVPPLVAVGGYFLYKGYLAASGPSEPTQASAGRGHGLRIFPSASASAGGIIAEFDF
jgi:hypothetical protein